MAIILMLAGYHRIYCWLIVIKDKHNSSTVLQYEHSFKHEVVKVSAYGKVRGSIGR